MTVAKSVVHVTLTCEFIARHFRQPQLSHLRFAESTTFELHVERNKTIAFAFAISFIAIHFLDTKLLPYILIILFESFGV